MAATDPLRIICLARQDNGLAWTFIILSPAARNADDTGCWRAGSAAQVGEEFFRDITPISSPAAASFALVLPMSPVIPVTGVNEMQ
ncbi:MAG TPA: hypothetical protein VF485_17410 [Sphingomonas sp.]